jgi:23S rRNA pseudouridine2457 synthase
LVTNKKIKLLGELHDFPEGTMSIGRLDKETEGLLLLTTNGKLSYLINSSKVEKEYYAQVDGDITDEAITKLRDGLDITVEGEIYRTLKCKVRKLDTPPDIPPRIKKIRGDHHGPTSWVSICLREGKNRQVRKMTAKVGFPTLRLLRYRIGNIILNRRVAGSVEEVDVFDLGI